jgi:prepilin-type N-terminal cleavage/methylation domain-containing protein
MKMKTRRNSAFTLIEILIVALIIGMLVTIAVPNFVRARETSRAKSCAQNLRVFEVAKDQYLMDNNLPRASAIVNSDVIGSSNYIKILPECPSQGTYTVGDGDVEAICSLGGAHNLRGY